MSRRKKDFTVLQQASNTLEGSFQGSPEDSYVLTRTSMLGGDLYLPELANDDIDNGLLTPPALARHIVSSSSATLCIQFAKPMPVEQFLELGRKLGSIIPERDPIARQHSPDGNVLDIIEEHRQTDDQRYQPFAANPLSLHSESSGAAIDDQPRYVMLQCLQATDRKHSPKTVITPMRTVASKLAEATRQVLSRTHYQSNPQTPILRWDDSEPVFSFRDFDTAALHWVCHDETINTASVNTALSALLAAIYDPIGAYVVSWKPGKLLVINNRKAFHGRRVFPKLTCSHGRHLQRLRIQ